jgi:hypothetical protein
LLDELAYPGLLAGQLFDTDAMVKGSFTLRF